MTQPIRVNYFDRQHLRLAEFRVEQAYHIAIRRRHNLSHHSWGIVVGLEIVQEGNRAVLLPGLAIDGYGRELLLLEHVAIGRDVFDRYATTRLDVWLVYQLELADDRTTPVECGTGDPRARYRAIEKARVDFVRAGAARVDGHAPADVPVEDLENFPPQVPDDPARKWPVYIGRVVMSLDEGGTATFEIDARDRVYAGLSAAIIDHPGTPARIELGLPSDQPDARTVGGVPYTYASPGQNRRDFAVFVPPEDGTTDIQPTISVEPDGTQIRGTTIVHGNVVLDGTALEFPSAINLKASPEPLVDVPSIYRAEDSSSDALRIDAGAANSAKRRIVIGLTKDGKFQPGLTIDFSPTPPTVTVHGDLHLDGAFDADDIRLRTLKEDVVPQLAAMFNLAVLSA
jgi:hypothetical protein